MGATRLPQAVPDLHGPGRVGEELPAELADVAHSLGEHRRSADRNRPRAEEGEAIVRDVVVGGRGHDIAGRRPPDPDHRQLIGLVADADVAVGRIHVRAQPAQIGRERARARHDTEPIGAEPRHRHVRDDPAPPVQELRVDDRSLRPVDPVVGDTFEKRERSRAGDPDLAERRQVEHRGAFADGPVLLADPRQERRLREAPGSLVGAESPPGLARVQVLRPLPSVLDPKRRAVLLEPGHKGALPFRPPPLVLVERVAQPVVVAIRLARRLGRVGGVGEDAAEAPGAIAEDVELGLAARYPLRDGLADAAGAAEPVERHPGRHEEAAQPRHRTEQRIAVRRHRVGMAHELHDLRVGDEGKPPGRPLQQLLEPVEIGRERGASVLPGNAVDPARHRIRLVPAEQDPTGLGLAVHEVVGVAKARHVRRQLRVRDGLEGDVLVVDGRRGNEDAGHGGDPRRPDSRGVHDHFGLDPAVIGDHGPHLAPGRELDAGDADAGSYRHAERLGGGGQRVRRPVRIEMTIAGHGNRAEQRFGRGRRHQLPRLLRRQQLDLEPDPLRPRHAAAKLQQLVGAGCESQAPDGLEDTELPEQLDRITPEPHHRRRGVEHRDQTGRVKRRAARQLALLEQHDVGPAGEPEVIGDAAAHHAAADDDDSGAVHGWLRPKRRGGGCPPPRVRSAATPAGSPGRRTRPSRPYWTARPS